MFGRRPPPDALKARVRRIGETSSAFKPLPASNPARAPRQFVFRNGTLFYGQGHRLAVVIKDLSDAGARIEFFQRTHLPDDVELSEPSLRFRRAARVVWRTDGAAGLRFV